MDEDRFIRMASARDGVWRELRRDKRQMHRSFDFAPLRIAEGEFKVALRLIV